MGRRKKRMDPFEVEITHLGKGGVGVGLAPDGAPVKVRPGPPGSRIAVVPMGKRKGMWSARRVEMVRRPSAYAEPKCGAFGVCGGCTLQELQLQAQREAKVDAAMVDIETAWGHSIPDEVVIHGVRGTEQAYGTRNKVEISFGPSRFLREEEHRAGAPIDGRWMGFHAPGRFDRIADTERCWLMSDAANKLFSTLRGAILADDDQPLWNARTHEGVWRHALIREGRNTGELLVALYTTSAADDEAVARVADRLMETSLPEGVRLVGVLHIHNDGVADVARGDVARVWGQEHLVEHLMGVDFQLSTQSFFQTSTEGAEVLYRTVGEAVGESRGLLLDLYCGTGSIGLVLSDRAKRIVGVEEVASAVDDARRNAARLGVNAEYVLGKVEDTLDVFAGEEDVVAVVDPPRVGLHPKVARRLANWGGDTLIYVACKAGSLGRDAAILEAGGWTLKALWTVDLFPQTGHLEVVGRFERQSKALGEGAASPAED